MQTDPVKDLLQEGTHSWLHTVAVCYVPGPSIRPLEQRVIEGILGSCQLFGHNVQVEPDNHTDIILTTVPYGEPLSWRKTLSLVSRMQFNLDHTPTVYTLVNILPDELDHKLNYFEEAMSKEEIDPSDFEFPGLAPDAYKVLYEQGNRGGPILSLSRLIQAQAKCLHILLLVGDEEPEKIYHLDLVGGYPESSAEDLDSFYSDIVLRMVTTISTHEITQHQTMGEPIPKDVWDSLETPDAMRVAARKLGERNFFTDTVRINDLVQVPAVQDAVARQYSEGCYATWDPTIDALIATITGSARPVDKDNISEDDLAVIVGVRPDGQGALVRKVDGKRNDPPSSEAVELIEMDKSLAKIELSADWDISGTVPIARSKLHGHRGISSYNPDLVEFVPLDPPYYYYPVTCATEAQARGIREAFTRSETLLDPDDPRQVVFTILPTHGVVIVEKWVSGTAPFQTMWEYFDAGHLVVDNMIPQGIVEYSDSAGKKVLKGYM